jgi:hypothetical protein
MMSHSAPKASAIKSVDTREHAPNADSASLQRTVVASRAVFKSSCGGGLGGRDGAVARNDLIGDGRHVGAGARRWPTPQSTRTRRAHRRLVFTSVTSVAKSLIVVVSLATVASSTEVKPSPSRPFLAVQTLASRCERSEHWPARGWARALSARSVFVDREAMGTGQT